jgi:hypothetical protein
MNIPLVIRSTKENSGEYWRRIRPILNKFLAIKREISRSNLKLELKRRTMKLFLDEEIKRLNPENFGRFYSYLINCFVTIKKVEYDSLISCYINDNWARGKSGNKKYPYLK